VDPEQQRVRRLTIPRSARPALREALAQAGTRRVGLTWLFDLDNTLHDASHAAFGLLDAAMNDYIERELTVAPVVADQLRRDY
jgi:hypothetical protein